MTKKNNIFFMLNLQIGQRVQTTHAGATNLFYFIFFANQNRHQQTNNWKKWSHLIEQKKIFIMILAFLFYEQFVRNAWCMQFKCRRARPFRCTLSSFSGTQKPCTMLQNKTRTIGKISID